MKNYFNKLWDWETFSAIYGWLMFSLLAWFVISLIFNIINTDYWIDLSEEIRIIVSLIIGYCLFYPYWDNRKR